MGHRMMKNKVSDKILGGPWRKKKFFFLKNPPLFGVDALHWEKALLGFGQGILPEGDGSVLLTSFLR